MSGAMGNRAHRSSNLVRDTGHVWRAGRVWRAGCTAVGLVAALLLAACSPSAPSSASSSADDQAAAQQSAQADQPVDPAANMVAAVSTGGSAGPISVKFRVEARPVVGMPVKILVALIPDADAQLSKVHGTFVPGEGLALQSDRDFDLGQLQPGTTVFREVTVVPQQTGVLSLDATLLLQSDKVSQSRTYSIPLIASDNSTT